MLPDDSSHELAIADVQRKQERHRPARHHGGWVHRRKDIRCGKLRVLVENSPLEPPQRLTGLDPQLVNEHPARFAERRHRLGLPAGAVERHHQLAAQTFAVWMLEDQALELGHRLRVPAKLEICLHAILERGQAQLSETFRLAAGEPVVWEVRQRFSAEQRKRFAELRGSQRGAVGVGLGGHALEAANVDLVLRSEPQHIPRRTRLDPVRPKPLAQR